MIKGGRRQARELAVKFLYGQPPAMELDKSLMDYWQNFRFAADELGDVVDDELPLDADVVAFTETLSRGTVVHRDEIDKVIAGTSNNWSVERMAKVDLAILRLAVYELLYTPETPVRVVINEAIEIGKRFGTGESSSFLNGILDRIAHQVRKEDK